MQINFFYIGLYLVLFFVLFGIQSIFVTHNKLHAWIAKILMIVSLFVTTIIRDFDIDKLDIFAAGICFLYIIWEIKYGLMKLKKESRTIYPIAIPLIYLICIFLGLTSIIYQHQWFISYFFIVVAFVASFVIAKRSRKALDK